MGWEDKQLKHLDGTITAVNEFDGIYVVLLGLSIPSGLVCIMLSF